MSCVENTIVSFRNLGKFSLACEVDLPILSWIVSEAAMTPEKMNQCCFALTLDDETFSLHRKGHEF